MPPACAATVRLVTLTCPLNPTASYRCRTCLNIYVIAPTDISEGVLTAASPSLKVHYETNHPRPVKEIFSFFLSLRA